MRADLETTNLDSMICLEPISDAGREWLAGNVPDYDGPPLVCDYRCGIDIMQAALSDGLILCDGRTGRIARAA